MLLVFPTGHWPRSPASTLIGSHSRSADVETRLQRVKRLGGVNNRAEREITMWKEEQGLEARQKEV